MKYWVRSLKHNGVAAARQLADCALVVHDGLQLLGKDVSYRDGDQQIIIGGSLVYPKLTPAIPDDAIIYNFEQAGTFHFGPEYVRLLQRCRVWDYNPINGSRLNALYGVKSVNVPFGYVPAMTRVLPERSKDIDVMFTGSMFSPQRQAIVQQMIHKRGLAVFFSDNCYGANKDDYYARSRLVLNMHIHKEKIMETLRIGDALANRMPVLSQLDMDTAREDDIVEACFMRPYEQLSEAAHYLVKNNGMLESLSTRGHEIFKKRWMPEILEKVL